MKGIIVEKEKEYAIVLDNNGQFWEIKTPQDLNIGYEVDIPSKKKISFKTIVAITAVIIIIGLSVGLYRCFSHFR
ncbi:MAG: anti-sigma factor domain-containing protein [Clostridium sp.]|nr:anti-sigma factor domain-containing protein [Clostridium sp.]